MRNIVSELRLLEEKPSLRIKIAIRVTRVAFYALIVGWNEAGKFAFFFRAEVKPEA